MIMRQREGAWRHGLVLGYGVVGYACALLMLGAEGWFISAIGMLLLAHTLVISSYLVHECTHNTIFADLRWNARLGELLDWLAGASYGSYNDIRRKHLRHHADRADVIAFDYRALLLRHPLALKLVQALEWCYIPAVDLLMHALVILLPFIGERRRKHRVRVLVTLFSRVLFFTLLALYSFKALILYLPAYLLFLHVMRFMDVHQHTYDVVTTLDDKPATQGKAYDRAFEDRNTYSNVISLRYPWLNLLMLNFGYHNAHHVRPTAPWFALPELHQRYFGEDRSRLLPFSKLLHSYHRYRVARVLNGDAPDSQVSIDSPMMGVVGVSFLTAH
jgi:fatty acid desaturase